MRKLLTSQNRRQSITLLVFSVLNTLLWFFCAEFIPQRDVGAYFVGLTCLLALPKSFQQEKKLVATKEFHQSFAILSTFEVLVTLVIPWILILREVVVGTKQDDDDDDKTFRFLLAPHLFVFQAQIALEALVTESTALMFWYTCVANSYRAIALATWMKRTLDTGLSARLSLGMILPVFAVLLWICSNCFIVFVWYPLLPSSTGKTGATIIKGE